MALRSHCPDRARSRCLWWYTNTNTGSADGDANVGSADSNPDTGPADSDADTGCPCRDTDRADDHEADKRGDSGQCIGSRS